MKFELFQQIFKTLK